MMYSSRKYEEIVEVQVLPHVAWNRRYVAPFTVYVGFACLVLLICVVGISSGVEITDIAWAVAIIAVIGVIFGRLSSDANRYGQCEECPRTVSLTCDARVFRLSTPSARKVFPINECCWFLGKETDDESFDVGQRPRQVAIVVLPTGQRVSCGVDPKLTDKWLAGLRCVGCPRVVRREGLMGVCGYCVSMVFLITGGIAGFWTANVLGQILSEQGGSVARIVQGSAITSGCFGFFLVWWMLIPGWYRPIATERVQLYRFAALLPAVLVLSRRNFILLPFWHAIVFCIAWAVVLLLVTALLIKWKEAMSGSRRCGAPADTECLREDQSELPK